MPAEAFEPVFCTWTAIHHAVDQEWVLNNARLAAGLGFKTWITDDGWFTEKASFADYRYSGDWQPALKKFPDFAGHVRQVQAMGFKYLLWVAPFMVGQASAAAKTYAHLLQKPIERLHFANLHPVETGNRPDHRQPARGAHDRVQPGWVQTRLHRFGQARGKTSGC